MQFSCAKIADKVADLDLFRPFKLTEIVRRPIEIVHVAKSAEADMVRVTMDKQGYLEELT